MTLLHEAVDAKKMDVRLVERNINRGVMSAEEVEKNLKKLPDDSENAEYIAIESLMTEGNG
jgi:hypothetical protein